MEGWQFNGVLQAAANMPVQGERGTYTRQMFAGDFPQFLKAGKEPRECLVPEGIFELFVENANQSILPQPVRDYLALCRGSVCSSLLHAVPENLFRRFSLRRPRPQPKGSRRDL